MVQARGLGKICSLSFACLKDPEKVGNFEIFMSRFVDFFGVTSDECSASFRLIIVHCEWFEEKGSTSHPAR